MFKIKVGQIVEVGRSSDAGMVVTEDRQMSRRHFALEYDGVNCHIRDLESANGTFVAGGRVTVSLLRVGDRIEAGESAFVLREGLETRQFTSPEEVARKVGPEAAAALENDLERRQAGTASEYDARVMELNNHTPYSVATMFWEDLDARPKMSVIVKGTFVIKTDAVSPLAAIQLPVFRADQHYGDDPLGSVRFESDMVSFKPCTDIVLVGQAHAPGGRPVDRLEVGLRVGSRMSAITVYGDRYWAMSTLGAPGANSTSPNPFVTMDLVYERAFGGMDEAASMYYKYNLVGTGFIGRCSRESIQGKRLPNLEDPHNPVRAWDSRPKPVGFGFFGRGWMPRLGFAGTYDETYRTEIAPRPPHDFSYRFFNGAHPDLQVEGYLRGDEVVNLVHLTPQPRLHFQLPGVRPRISVRKRIPCPQASGGKSISTGTQTSNKFQPIVDESMTANLDTVVFIPNEGIFYQVFRVVCELEELDPAEISLIEVRM